jgi:Putative zinc-finger
MNTMNEAQQARQRAVQALRDLLEKTRLTRRCPDVAALAGYAEGGLPADEQAEIAEHVSRCESCAASVGEDGPARPARMHRTRLATLSAIAPQHAAELNRLAPYLSVVRQLLTGADGASILDVLLRTPRSQLSASLRMDTPARRDRKASRDTSERRVAEERRAYAARTRDDDPHRDASVRLRRTEEQDLFILALLRLPACDRELLMLRLKGKPLADIARDLQLPASEASRLLEETKAQVMDLIGAAVDADTAR